MTTSTRPGRAIRAPQRGVYLLPNLFTTAVPVLGFLRDRRRDRRQLRRAPASRCSSRWSATDSTDASRAGPTRRANSARSTTACRTWSPSGSRRRSSRTNGASRASPSTARSGDGSAGSPRSSTPPARRSGWRASTRASASADKRFFEGLPSPSGAALLAGFVWMLADLQREGLRALVLAFAVALIAGGLMVSRFRYVSGKDLDRRCGSQSRSCVLVPLGFVAGGVEPARDAVRAVRVSTRVGAAAAGSGACVAATRHPRRRTRAPGIGRCRSATRGLFARARRRRVRAARRLRASSSTCAAASSASTVTAGHRRRHRGARPVIAGPAAARRATPVALDGPGAGTRLGTVARGGRGVPALRAARDAHADVFGVGDREARWMFIGEAPGAGGRPPGRAVRRPRGPAAQRDAARAGHRARRVSTLRTCSSAARRATGIPSPRKRSRAAATSSRQIELVDPTLMIAVGRIAAQRPARHRNAARQVAGHGAHASARATGPLVVTYHPAYLLRSPARSARPGRTCSIRAASVHA